MKIIVKSNYQKKREKDFELKYVCNWCGHTEYHQTEIKNHICNHYRKEA